MGLKLATELSMRSGRTVQNMHSSYLASENFYKNRSSPLQIPPSPIILKISTLNWWLLSTPDSQYSTPFAKAVKISITNYWLSSWYLFSSTSRNLHHTSQHLSRRFHLSIAVTFYSSVKYSPVFSVTDTNFCDLMYQWITRHALKVLYSLLSSNTQNLYKSVLIRIQCVFNIMTLLRTNRVLHEICIDIKVSVSDFLRMDYEDLTR